LYNDVFHSPALSANYPQLTADTVVQRGVFGKGTWQHGEEGIPHFLNLGKGSTRSTVAHELGGHGVQNVEGFATGGNVSGAFPTSGKGGAWPIYRERIDNILTPLPLEDYARRAGFDSVDDARTSYASYVADIGKMRREGVPSHIDRSAQESSAEEWYRRLAGEVEARNVANRLGMTSDERRAKPPWSTEDVPWDQQIVRFPKRTDQ
jgi:hypothetical protein